jgi:hypothetical protein
MIGRLLFVVVPGLFIVGVATQGCFEEEAPADARWSNSMKDDEISMSSQPTLTFGTTGEIVIATWRAEIAVSKDHRPRRLSVTLHGPTNPGSFQINPGRIRVAVRGELPPQTFTAYETMSFYGSNEQGGDGLELGAEDLGGNPATRAEGAIVFENLTVERGGAPDARVHVRVRFEDVRITTVNAKSSAEFASILSGTLDIVGQDKPEPPPSTSSSGGSSSGSSASSSSGGSSSGGTPLLCDRFRVKEPGNRDSSPIGFPYDGSGLVVDEQTMPKLIWSQNQVAPGFSAAGAAERCQLAGGGRLPTLAEVKALVVAQTGKAVWCPEALNWRTGAQLDTYLWDTFTSDTMPGDSTKEACVQVMANGEMRVSSCEIGQWRGSCVMGAAP